MMLQRVRAAALHTRQMSALLVVGSSPPNLKRRPSVATYSTASGRRKLPMNTGLVFVPQQQAWIVERFGKFNRTMDPGFNICIPFAERIAYVQNLKEIALDVPHQSAITLDNVTLQIDGVLYFRVTEPYKASYGIEDHEYAVTQLAQTTMRSELGKMSMDNVFQERTSLNAHIVEAINTAAEAWGMRCMRYEIRDIQLPNKVKDAMQMQVEAERKKRAQVLTSEGERQAAINIAEGKRQSKILESEAVKIEQVNQAEGEAKATIAKAEARAKAILAVAEAIGREYGDRAASLSVAEQYVNAFSNLAKTTNTLLLPSDTGDISSMVSQAMAIYGQLTKVPVGSAPSAGGSPPSAPVTGESEEGEKHEPSVQVDVPGGQVSAGHKVRGASLAAGATAIGLQAPFGRQRDEESHFSIATSPTRQRDYYDFD